MSSGPRRIEVTLRRARVLTAAWSLISLLLVGLVLAACGRDELAPAEVVASSSSAIVPATTAGPRLSTTTSSTTTSSTVPTTTIPAVLPELVRDVEGSPVNGQARGVLVSDAGWVAPILSGIVGGHRVWTPCGGQADVAGGEVLWSADVVIDPGHGGRIETGAVGAGGTREADLNLAVARQLAEVLRAEGFQVLLTRDEDFRLPIVTRAEIARAVQPALFLSLHFNGGSTAPSPTPGTEMFFQYTNPESRRLAGLIYEEVVATLEGYDTPWVALSDSGVIYRLNRDGEDYYGVLRRTGDVVSVLVEYLYLSNPAEEQLVTDPAVQRELVTATRDAVLRFLNTDDPGSGFQEPMFRGYGSSGTGRINGCDDPPFPSP